MLTRAKKERPYVVRLEWASMISFCDVAVTARTPAEAIQRAYEDCDYERQDNYDDGSESYVTAICEAPTLKRAEQIVDHGCLWDLGNAYPIPLKERSQDEQRHEHERRAAYLRAALARAQAALSDAARQLAKSGHGDLVARLDNESRKAAYLVNATK